MPVHLQREVQKLKKMILSLSAQVEESVFKAVEAVTRRDDEMARSVIHYDTVIDLAEVEVEEEGLKILALHQPVAIDLRFIIAVLKINNDLERIGDLAVNMAQRALLLNKLPVPPGPLDLTEIAQKTRDMLRRSLDSLVNMDAALARRVCELDSEVDEMNRAVYERVKRDLHEQPRHINALIHMLSVSRHLERIADHATNIAEDVVYMIEGELIRHHAEKRAAGLSPNP
jgi:phosphate transport system protein